MSAALATSLRVALCLVALSWISLPVARAQHMYLDSDGDGVHTDADRLNPLGIPTSVDLYLTTNRDRNGEPVTCNANPETPLTFSAYTFNLLVEDGTALFSDFINRRPEMPTNLGERDVDGVNYTNGQGGTTHNAPGGPFLLCSLTIIAQSGVPRVVFSDFGAFGEFTAFGTLCEGSEFDNTYKLTGPQIPGDWTDADGLGPPSLTPIGDLPPQIAAPDTVRGIEQSPMTFEAATEDPEGDPIYMFSASGLPIGASFVANATNTVGTFTWTPGTFQAGTYTLLLSATSARRPSGVSGVAGPPRTTTKTVHLRIANLDRPPSLDVPAYVLGAEHVMLGFSATGSDPDADPVTVTFGDLPAGAQVTTLGSISTFTWTPQTGQAGERSVTVTARSTTLQTSETVVISVLPNMPPVVEGPALVGGRENEPVTFEVRASDPDGDDIVLLSAVQLPPNASFTADADQRSGVFRWTPDFNQAGAHTVSIAARSAARATPVSGTLLGYAEGSLVTRIEVANMDRPPVISQMPTQSVDEGATLRTPFFATDPDFELIEVTLFAPSFARLELEPYVSWFVPGTLVLEPGHLHAGVYPGNRIRAEAGEGARETTFDIVVNNRNAPPMLDVPSDVSGSEGVPMTFGIFATDVDGGTLALGALDLPFGATFADHGDNTGGFAWAPEYDQGGEYLVRFTARDSEGLVGEPGDVHITVGDVNRAPIANPGGPYSGTINVPVTFDGAGSRDPDGGPLTMIWEFGDGSSGEGVTPSHAYGNGGVFVVRLTVHDGAFEHTASTTATIQSVFEAGAFLEDGSQTTRLHSSKPTTCVQLEAIAESYVIDAVNLGSIVMASPGTGGLDRISAVQDKTTVGADRNRNGVAEVTACFSKQDLRLLFSDLPGGRHTVTVTIEGALLSGGTFRAELDMTVVSSGGGLASAVSPNPAKPDAVLTIRTTKSGTVTVSLFDAHGRLVRTLLQREHREAGYHDIPAGGHLRSGVYFYKVTAAEGEVSGRLVVAR